MHSGGVRSARFRGFGRWAWLHNVSYATFVRTLLSPFPALIFLFPASLPCRAESPPVWGYLDNGMGYLLLESHAAPLIGTSMIIHSGSAREEFATSGASHFLEHLLFNGTESRTQEQLYDAVDAIGGYNNATTRDTHVVFMMVTPAEKVRDGMEIQRDMLFHSTLPAEKVEKERGIILEEMARDTDTGGYALERLLNLSVFGPSGPGLPVLGSQQSIRSMPREAILDFYRKFYVARNMTLLVVGDFDSIAMEKTIREIYGQEPPGATPPPFAIAEPACDSTPLVSHHEGANGVFEWSWPGPDPSTPGFLAYEALVDLLAGEEAAPVNAAVRGRFPGMIQSAGGRLEGWPSGSLFRYRIEAEATIDWRECAREVPEILASSRALPDPADFEAWRVSERTEEFFLRERPHYYGVIAGSRIASEGLAAVASRPERLEALSLASMAAILPDWPSALPPCVTVALPKPVTTQPDATPTQPAAVDRSELPNGAELLVLSSPESPVLALHLFVKGRSQTEPQGQDGAAELLHRLMGSRTSRSDPAELTRRLRAIGAELKTADDPNIPYDDFYSTSGHSYVRLQTLDEHADEAFSILGEILGPPAWTDADFEEQRGAMLAQAKQAAAGTRARARELLRSTLYGDRPEGRSVFGTPQSLEAITPGSLRDFAAEYFTGRRLLLVAATSLPPAMVHELAARSIGALPSGSPPQPKSPFAPLPHLRAALRSGVVPASSGIPSGDSLLVLADSVGGRQATVLEVRAIGNADAASLPALEVWNAIVSSRIQFQLREREGLAYSIGSSVERASDGTVLWYASAGTAAGNIPRIIEGFEQALREGLAQPPDSSTIARQGIQIYGRSLMRRATRMNRAYAAGLALMDGRDPAAIDDEIRAPMRVDGAGTEKLVSGFRGNGPGVLAVVR